MGVEFSYFSIMTSIMRLNPRIREDTGLQKQLLYYARQSLSSLEDMQNHLKVLEDSHTFRASVSW
jgi:hypothetical protein